ncbi:MAG: hypothetical protein R3214_09880 [Christiangramia sp.]|nr:hypothetical protein [Christiangramia sp.]
MKLDIFFVNAGILLLVFIPYFLFILLADKERKQLKQNFQRLVTQHKLSPDILYSWNKNRIGIDRKSFKLLVVKKCNLVTHIILDMRLIRRCNIHSEFKNIKVRGYKEDILQRVELQIETVGGEWIKIDLFDSNRDYRQDKEVLHATKLSETINSLLSYKPVLSSAA